MKNLFLALVFVPALLVTTPLAMFTMPLAAWASEAGYRLDRAPIDTRDLLSLQAGARTFVNYCLNCHSAQYMRYNRLTDLGLTESQIRDNLIFTDAKVGDTMKVALTLKDGKAMFGAAPPDLSVIGRSRGADWLYSYLRAFYRDEKSPTGWNNAVFPQVAMAHALWSLQGERGLVVVAGKNHGPAEYQWSRISAGTQNTKRFTEHGRLVRRQVDDAVADHDIDGAIAQRQRFNLPKSELDV